MSPILKDLYTTQMQLNEPFLVGTWPSMNKSLWMPLLNGMTGGLGSGSRPALFAVATACKTGWSTDASSDRSLLRVLTRNLSPNETAQFTDDITIVEKSAVDEETPHDVAAGRKAGEVRSGVELPAPSGGHKDAADVEAHALYLDYLVRRRRHEQSADRLLTRPMLPVFHELQRGYARRRPKMSNDGVQFAAGWGLSMQTEPALVPPVASLQAAIHLR
jgi:hypothetical protein